ncbi:Adenosine monophosphate-protein transferase FICD [Fusarium oxysporum f. sp. albedinis]|nr:Adenosine monophosphate-protein transferase FICD [Fusarium oxysporum f. sp. albedinis]
MSVAVESRPVECLEKDGINFKGEWPNRNRLVTKCCGLCWAWPTVLPESPRHEAFRFSPLKLRTPSFALRNCLHLDPFANVSRWRDRCPTQQGCRQIRLTIRYINQFSQFTPNTVF